jgi:hypothetical protein
MQGHWTRRQTLIAAAGVALARLLPGSAALARPPADRARPTDLTLDVPLHRDRGPRLARSRWVTSPPLRASRSLTLLGLSWRGADPGTLEIRVRRRGRWSRWVDVPALGGHGPDGVRAPKATDGAFVGGARVFQVRAGRRPATLRAHGVAVDRPSGAGVAARGPAPAVPGAPAMVTRDQWRAQAPRSRPLYARIDLAFVHHTVSTNDYSAREAPQVVRAIQHYHRNTLGWDDVGYNFLVDRFGTIYEGRGGGIENAVVGAQAQGWNSVSFGIASIGTHTADRISPTTFEAIAQTVAWKLGVHGVPVDGEVTLTSDGGGGSNRHPAGRLVRFDRISGHRDACSTSCPGNALFDQLPALRARAADLEVGLGLSLRVGRPRTGFRRRVKATGRLAFEDGAPPEGLPVEIQARYREGWRSEATAVVEADETFSVPVALEFTRELRAVFAGDEVREPLVSRPVRLDVRSQVSLVAPKRLAPGRPLTVEGTVQPLKRSQKATVRLERRIAGGRWVLITSRLSTVSDGSFAARLPRLGTGTYRLSASVRGDRLNAPARSPRVALNVR